MRGLFGGTNVEFMRVVEDDQFRFSHRLPGNGGDDFIAQRFDRADRILSRQMYAKHAPAMRLERLEISQVLRLVELREIVRRTRDHNRVAMVLSDLQKQAGVRTALVQ